MKSFNVEDLAQEIRRVDGNHSMGAGALAEALIPFLASPPLPQQRGEQTPAKLKPTETGIYAWVADGCASLVIVNKRPSNHSPSGVLNGHLMQNSNFYDGCAIEKWSGGRWFGPLSSDTVISSQVGEAKNWQDIERAVDRHMSAAYQAGMDGDEFDMLAAKRKILALAATATLGEAIKADEEHPWTFPIRDENKAAEQQGLFQKFHVRRVDGSDAPGAKHHGCKYFVLDLDHDHASAAAMHAYAIVVADTHPVLGAELLEQYPTALQGIEVKPVERLSDVQVDSIRNEVMQQLSAENSGVIGSPDVEHMQFPKRFAEAIMTALGSPVPACGVCGDTGKWLAGYTGLFGGGVPVYETCKCVAAPACLAEAKPVALDFEQIEECMPEEGIFTSDDGYIKCSAQFLHDFAKNVASICAAPVAQALPVAAEIDALDAIEREKITVAWLPMKNEWVAGPAGKTMLEFKWLSSGETAVQAVQGAIFAMQGAKP